MYAVRWINGLHHRLNSWHAFLSIRYAELACYSIRGLNPSPSGPWCDLAHAFHPVCYTLAFSMRFDRSCMIQLVHIKCTPTVTDYINNWHRSCMDKWTEWFSRCSTFLQSVAAVRPYCADPFLKPNDVSASTAAWQSWRRPLPYCVCIDSVELIPSHNASVITSCRLNERKQTNAKWLPILL